MEGNTTLADRLRQVWINGKFVAFTNYKELITDVSWEQATQKVSDLNTIAALTYHINYYTAGILNVFYGGKLEIRDKFSFDLPPIRSKEDWDKLVEEFLSNAEKFINHVDQMTEEELQAPFVDEKYGTYQRNIEGVIEHSYYHMGQISLIKKMILK